MVYKIGGSFIAHDIFPDKGNRMDDVKPAAFLRMCLYKIRSSGFSIGNPKENRNNTIFVRFLF